MKLAVILLALMFYIYCSSLPTSPPTSMPVAPSSSRPCQICGDFKLAAPKPNSNYMVCKNIFLQPKNPMVLDSATSNAGYLMFEDSALSIISTDAFSSFPKLVQLYLNRSDVKILCSGAFNGLPDLEELYLQDNAIMDIPDGTISPLNSLRILDLSRNALTIIQGRPFIELRNLKVLNLTDNSLYYLEGDSFLSLVNLEVLDLSHNYLSKANPDFKLNLGTKSLRQFFINNNLLIYFPLVMKEELNLEVLDVSSNGLTAVDFEFVPRARFSNFSNNEISVITGWSNLNYTVVIDLGKNKLKADKSTEGDMDKLYLGANKLEKLDAFVFGKLKNVSELDLGYCAIMEINVDAFQNLVHLKKLYLNNNQIRDVPVNCLSKLPSLTVLSLSHNSLTGLREGVFDGLSELTDLYLDHNQLATINETSFHVLSNLRCLNLNNNKLKLVNIPLFAEFVPSLQILSFEHNNWDCVEMVKSAIIFHKNLSKNHLAAFYTAFEVDCNNSHIRMYSASNNNKLFYTLYQLCTLIILFIHLIFIVRLAVWYIRKSNLNAQIKGTQQAKYRYIPARVANPPNIIVNKKL